MVNTCQSCVLDTSVSGLVLEDGICNYCRGYKSLQSKIDSFDLNAYGQTLPALLRERSNNKEYDCIVGISGGLDSSHLLSWLTEIGIKPYVLHIDTGWNSEIATRNIFNLVSRLGLKLKTVVIDWNDLMTAQRAFFKANLIDCDVPQDHCFTAILYKTAKETGIRNVISGHNLFMEYVLPTAWSFNSNDSTHIKDVVAKMENTKLKNFPYMSPARALIDRKVLKKVITYRPFMYHWFDKDKIQEHLNKHFGWEDYGGKHYESEFTKFFQGDYLVEKFNIDKRKAHFSNLILSNQITRDRAKELLEEPTMSALERNRLRLHVKNKLNLSDEEWSGILGSRQGSHSDFKQDYFLKLQGVLMQ